MGFAIFAMVAFGQYRSMEEAKVLAEKFIQSKKGKTRAIAERSLSVIDIPLDSLYMNKTTVATQVKSMETTLPSPKNFENTPCMKTLPKSVSYTSVPAVIRTPFYVFNDSLAGHFVIVAADERMTTILGYADNGIFDYSSTPDAMKHLMSQYAEEYNFLQTTTEKLERNNQATSILPVSPLLSAVWGQGLPFNRQAPYIGIHRGVTGCVATAMAQIMYKHKYPATGFGQHSYVSETEELDLSQDFSATSFDWESMCDDYSGIYANKAANAVATLMRSCGIAVNMDYCYTSGGATSGAYSFDVPYALRTHFGYNDNVVYYAKDYFSNEEWNEIIYEELNAGRPIYYSGSGDLGGHAFVLDGCDLDGLFHINWGWNGQFNGYFSLSALEPYEYCSFSSGQAMVCRIAPETWGEEETTFYAASFIPYLNEVKEDSVAYFGLVNCYNYSNRTSYTRQDIAENWTLSLALYDEEHTFVKNLDAFDTELSSLWGYKYAWLGFTPSEVGLVEGKTYYVVPTVSRAGENKQTRIRTEKGETDFYEVKLSNGNLIIGEREFTSFFEVDGVRYSVLEEAPNCVEVKGISSDEESFIYIPESVTYNNITYTVTNIGDEAFLNMNGLWSVQLSSTIKHIGRDAFKGCQSLMELISEAEVPPTCASWTNYPFSDVCQAELLVPDNTRGLYRSADGWNEFIRITELGEDVSMLDDVTDQYVNNPYFDYSFYGWETTTGAINNQLNDNQTDWYYATGYFWENWNASPFSGKMYQVLSVPNGVYKLEMAAFADMAYGAYVYANTATAEVLSANFDRVYSVEVIVTDGVLEIGLLMPEAIHTWVGMDNVRLYYSENIGEKLMSELLAGQIKSSFDVTFRNSMESALLVELKTEIEEAKVALLQDVESEMKSAYDELVDVTKRAQASSEKYQKVRYALDILNQEISVSKAAEEVIQEATALYEKVWTSYIGGVWTVDEEFDTAVAELEMMIIKVKVPNVANASDENPIDMTSVIKNNDLTEYNLDWMGSGGWLMNTYYQNVEFYNENFSYYQELKGLPNGIYRISVQGFYRPGSFGVANSYYQQDDRSKLHAILFADTGDTITQTYVQSIMEGASTTMLSSSDVLVSGKYIPNDMASAASYFSMGKYTENFLYVEVKNNKLVIGLFKDVWINDDWMIFNQWNLYYYGENSEHYHGECSGTYKLSCIGGDETVSMELCPGDSIVLPEDYAKYGHTLTEWKNVPTVMPAKNLTLIAEFTPTVYAVVYRDVDGTELFRDSVAYDTPLVLRDYPLAEGDVFNAWVYEGGEIPQNMPANDVELVADVVTGISEIQAKDKIVNVYTIDGSLLKQGILFRDLSNVLDAGLYIVDGRKIYIKK